jgi:CBS domain containing-hemolysin-like protein
MSLGLVCDRILDIIGRRKAKALSHEEYLSYLESCVERDAFTPEEAKLLNETFALREKKVSEVMRARVNTGFIRNTASGAEVAALIREHSQAYLPVVSGNELDTAEAIISSLAFFSLPASERDAWRTSACILKPTLYIPEKIVAVEGPEDCPRRFGRSRSRDGRIRRNQRHIDRGRHLFRACRMVRRT